MKNLTKFRVCCGIIFITSFCSLYVDGPLMGALIVPEENSTNRGNLAWSGTFRGDFNADGAITQLHFSEAMLAESGIVPGTPLIGISFRGNYRSNPGLNQPAKGDANYQLVKITLSSVDKAPSELTSQFAANQSTDLITVRSGPMSFQQASFPGGSEFEPSPFGPQIPFDQVYTYQGGTLIMTILEKPENDVAVLFLDMQTGLGNQDARILWADDADASAADYDQNDRILITRFETGGSHEPPFFNELPDVFGDIGDTIQLIFSAVDPEGTKISYTPGITFPATAILDSQTGAFTWSPKERGVFYVTVIGTDEGSPPLRNETTLRVYVDEENIPPLVLEPRTSSQAFVNQEVVIMIRASDPNQGQSVSFSRGKDMPEASMLIDHKDGTADFIWTPSAPGEYIFGSIAEFVGIIA